MKGSFGFSSLLPVDDYSAPHVPDLRNICIINFEPAHMKLIVVVFFALITSYTIYQLHRIREWKNRPRRLCLSCHTVTKPDQRRDGTFVCVVCGYVDPVALDSRKAVDHFTLIGRTPPIC